MSRMEAALNAYLEKQWSKGFGDHLFSACGLVIPATGVRANVRVPATTIAWREFDLVSDRFQLEGEWCRLVVELKYGGIGYGSIGQVLFYKHVLAPRHSSFLKATRFIFVVIGNEPNAKRWNGQGVLESDAEAFLELFSRKYWPDPDIHAFSYRDLGLTHSVREETWHWSPARSRSP